MKLLRFNKEPITFTENELVSVNCKTNSLLEVELKTKTGEHIIELGYTLKGESFKAKII